MTEVPGRSPSRFHSFSFWIAFALVAIGVYLLAEGRLLRGPGVILAGILVGLLFRRPTRRHVAFAALTVTLATLLPIVLVAGLDLYLHYRYADSGGYNIWGYRGPIAGAKKNGERRIAVLGGSTAFGYGVKTGETYPSQLERELKTLEQAAGRGPVSVVNLAWNGEGAFAFRFNLEDYGYLDPDLVVLYSGYNDLARNRVTFRRESAIFRQTGYLPILPIVSAGWLRRDDLDLSATRDDRVVFRPNLADRSASQAADLARGIAQALEREVRRLSAADPGSAHPPAGGADCGRWTDYCHGLASAVRYALDSRRNVVVVTEPYLAGGGATASGQFDQQNAVRAMLAEQFPGEVRLHYLNMGRAIDLTDPALCYDGLHLTALGNAQLATKLAPAVHRILALMTQGENDNLMRVPPLPSPVEMTKHVQPELVALGRYEEARDEARKAALDKYDNKRSSDQLAEAYLGLGDTQQARTVLEQQIADGVDAPWTHRMLYLIAASTGDRALADREVAWGETHADRFAMLSAQADVAAASGRFARARELRALAFDDARPKTGAAGAVVGRQAIAELLAGETQRALDGARIASRFRGDTASAWTASLVFGLMGRSTEATGLADSFKNEAFPSILVERLWMPILQGSLRLGRGDPQGALDVLEPTVAYERGSYWPRFLRGLAHLKMGQGFQASLEFSRILAQPIVGPTDIVYVIAERQLARAMAMGGGAVALGPLYSRFFESWKHADRDLPLVSETREEYRDLRRSISLPPLPEGLWRTP